MRRDIQPKTRNAEKSQKDRQSCHERRCYHLVFSGADAPKVHYRNVMHLHALTPTLREKIAADIRQPYTPAQIGERALVCRRHPIYVTL